MNLLHLQILKTQFFFILLTFYKILTYRSKLTLQKLKFQIILLFEEIKIWNHDLESHIQILIWIYNFIPHVNVWTKTQVTFFFTLWINTKIWIGKSRNTRNYRFTEMKKGTLLPAVCTLFIFTATINKQICFRLNVFCMITFSSFGWLFPINLCHILKFIVR